MKIILASGSPRRRELLNMLGLTDLIIQPAKGEEQAEPGLSPDALVCSLSKAKALEVAAEHDPDDLVIAADTVVWHDGRVFGKPKNEEDAKNMLKALSGRTHEVYTGVTVLCGGICDTQAERTGVHFRELSDAEIDAYVKTGEPMDKAGAYGAQGKASVFVEGISGDFFNVMGLPLCRLCKMLSERGVALL